MMALRISAWACALLASAGGTLAADAERGRQVFLKVGCYECHGTVGQGGAAGRKLAPDPLPLDAFANFVRHTSGAMPPYSERILSDQDLADIHAYLSGLPPPPRPQDVPLLRP